MSIFAYYFQVIFLTNYGPGKIEGHVSSIGMGRTEPVNQTLICLKWRHLATLSGLRERDLCTFGNTLLYIAMSHPLSGLRVRTLTINRL